MYNSIPMPVDPAHLDSLDRALPTAADLAAHDRASVGYASVSSAAPSALDHNPDEFRAMLEAFAADLDATLVKAVNETRCDPAVKGSHRPGFAAHLVSSNAGYIANHATTSVLVVR